MIKLEFPKLMIRNTEKCIKALTKGTPAIVSDDNETGKIIVSTDFINAEKTMKIVKRFTRK